jgi:thiamine kinase-like enzyme
MAERHVGEMAQLGAILARLEPSLGEIAGEPTPLSGGITNHNFRVTLGGEDYVLRVHGTDTDLLGIDRQAERIACAQAAEMGIAPELIAAFDDCLVTRFVTCDAVATREIAEHAEELARALRRFHDSAAVLPTRFWVPDLLLDYGARVHEPGVGLPSSYAEARAVATRIAAAVPLRNPRPCHNDLLAGNIIHAHDEHKLLVVDWEYAGMGHPCFDLGNLSVNNDLNESDDELLLSGYYGTQPTDGQRATLALMRILSDAREAAWGVLQAEISKLEFDFSRYARTHFERLAIAVEGPRLQEWLDAAAASSHEEHDGQAT